jgi:hypothetical protein
MATHESANVPQSEFKKFDDVMKRILAVSHNELQKREKKYQKKRAKKKRR